MLEIYFHYEEILIYDDHGMVLLGFVVSSTVNFRVLVINLFCLMVI